MPSGPNRQNAVPTRIYLIDDDASVVEGMCDFLKLKGFVVRTFSNTAEALENMRTETEPFLLVTNMQMPGLSGLDLVRELHHLGGNQGLFEMIFLSTFADLNHAINALKPGVFDFLVKPVGPNRLVAAIHCAAVALELRRDARTNDSDLPSQMSETLTKAKELTSMIENITVCFSREVVAHTSPGQAVTPVQRLVVNPPHTLPGQASEENQMLHRIKVLQAARRSRDKLLPSCMDGDPAWEILLYVIEQSLLKRVASVTSASHATALPPTTAARKIDELVSTGWLLKRPDPSDGRRTLLAPTGLCYDRMRHYLLGLPGEYPEFRVRGV